MSNLYSQGLAALQGASWRSKVPGVMTAVAIALAASFIAEHRGGPQLLYALLFGMAFNFAAEGAKVKEGIDFAGRHLLRFGIALLGARITFEQVADLGPMVIVLVPASMAVTILISGWLGRRFGFTLAEGLLAGGAVAICGASAALALSAVLPRTPQSQRFTLLTVVGVTTLSTLAMIVYPSIGGALGLDPKAMGVFLGGTIHDVAQVAASGYMISPEVGDAAIVVKLFRVALLVPTVVIFSLIFRNAATAAGPRPPLLPGFLVAFVLLALVNSLGLLPPMAIGMATEVSRWCLVVAIAALGIKTSFKQLAELGWPPVALLVINTIVLAAVAVGALLLSN
jgi:uncharacterized integral membrane protein (TIGR00698 family)